MATLRGQNEKSVEVFAFGAKAGCLAILGAWLALAFGAVDSFAARNTRQLVSRSAAARNGLERAWFAQVAVDPQRSRVSKWLLYYDRIYAVTSSGLVTALDAETGEIYWTRHVGTSGFAAFGPGANNEYLGVVGGSKLYIYGRDDGRLIWSRKLGSAPSSGPALTNDRAFIALMSGRIEGYSLHEPEVQPWYYTSKGRTFLRPTATGDVVSWPTNAGNLYVCNPEGPKISFRLETNDDIVTSPAASPPYLYIASMDGYLYCMNENTGREKWRFSTGYAIVSSPAIVGDQAYVASRQPALHAVNAETGRERWRVRGASDFVAQGKDRVYAADQFGNLLVIDTTTGQQIGRLDAAEDSMTLVNDQTDRIFLANDRGLIQCLHEIGVSEPVIYREPVGAETQQEPAEEGDDAVADAVEPVDDQVDQSADPPPFGADAADEPSDDDSPFGGSDNAVDDDNPFGVPSDSAIEDNPFGDF